MNIYKEILRAQDEKKDFAVVTIVKAEGSTPRSANAKMMVFPDGKTIGTIGGGELESRAVREARNAIKRGSSALVEYSLDDRKEEGLSMKCGGDVMLHIEVFKAKPQLFIIGAGHVGRALNNIASMLDFEITVIDDRDEWANEDRFPAASNILVKEDMSKALDDIEVGEDDFIVIATRGHSHDKEALSNALKKKARYVGMIGSEKKVEEVFRQLTGEGVEKELLEKVRSPIGLDLGGETPEEIAVSIVAEILTVKYGRSGRPLFHRRNET
jgi:xanthine dehydrogenase accessory factor